MTPLRGAFLTMLTLSLLGPALAATSATYAGTDTTCPLYTPVGVFEQGAIDCRLDASGVVQVGACDAVGCDVVASGSGLARWGPPGYGYMQAAIGQWYPNASAAICTAYAELPASGVSCSGTSNALHATVGAGGCRAIFVSTGAVFDYFTYAVPPVVPYGAAYFSIRDDHWFDLCRDANGAPSIARSS